MMYYNKVVAAIKVDGQVLREDGDTVTIPFGSQYNILIKNLHSVRIQVKVSIDGKDATDKTWLIVEPNSSLELERFINNGNLSQGNRFKFIERTSKIEKHRGVQAEDGLIRIEYKVEKSKPVVQETVIHKTVVHHEYDWHWYPYYRPYYPSYPVYPTYPSITCNSGGLGGSVRGSLGSVNCNAANFTSGNIARKYSAPQKKNAAGITTFGEVSNQQFRTVSDFETETQSGVIVLKLRGCIAGKKATKAITVKSKPSCVVCGKVNKPMTKFCGECGTSLSVI